MMSPRDIVNRLHEHLPEKGRSEVSNSLIVLLAFFAADTGDEDVIDSLLSDLKIDYDELGIDVVEDL